MHFFYQIAEGIVVDFILLAIMVSIVLSRCKLRKLFKSLFNYWRWSVWSMKREVQIKKWKALPEEWRNSVIEMLQKELEPEFLESVRQHYNNYGDEWWARDGWHFGQGMALRNLIRTSGFPDDLLPSHNWDDYYIQALEDAAGLIDEP